MQSKSVSTREDFLRLLDPSTVACFWVSEGNLAHRETPYWWFDYLMNGVLESHVFNLPQRQKSFFTAKQFDNTFHLLQVEKAYPDLNKSFKEAFQLIDAQNKENTEHKKKVLCLSQNPQHFSLPAIKSNKNYEFEFILY